MSNSSSHRFALPFDSDALEPERADEAAARDEWAHGWYDSSYELRRGLMVIELDLDPALTHGVPPRPTR